MMSVKSRMSSAAYRTSKVYSRPPFLDSKPMYRMRIESLILFLGRAFDEPAFWTDNCLAKFYTRIEHIECAFARVPFVALTLSVRSLSRCTVTPASLSAFVIFTGTQRAARQVLFQTRGPGRVLSQTSCHVPTCTTVTPRW